MTVNRTDVESILAPLRELDSFDNRMISLRSMGFPDNPFAPPERRKAWAAVRWANTSAPPVSDWLGNTELGSSHDEVLRRMRVATFIAFMDMVPVLAPDHPWCLIDHQAGGHACRHPRFIGRRISLKPDIEFKCLEIATFWYNTQLGWDLPCLSDLMKYRSQLQEFGFDCNSSKTFQHLMEGLYPADLTQSVIDRVCQHPFSLESLLGSPRPYGSVEHYAILVIIARNSD